MELFSSIEEVEQFAAVNFIKREVDFHFRIKLIFDEEKVFCRQIVHPQNTLFRTAIHGVGFPGPRLSVSETCDFGSFEGALQEGVDMLFVKLLVIGEMVESSIKVEVVFFDIASEVNFESG